jgi:ankyrin repeat protein
LNNKYYISNAIYNQLTRTLEIEWTIDVARSFFNVPKEIYQGLCNAVDKEQYYREKIMDNFEGRQKWRNLEELLKIAADILLINDLSMGVNSANCSNETAVHLAAFWGDVEAIQLLASLGAKIDSPGDCDCTPLYDAVTFGHVEATKLLLKLGASPDSCNDLEITPYEQAVMSGNLELIEAFSEYVKTNSD